MLYMGVAEPDARAQRSSANSDNPYMPRNVKVIMPNSLVLVTFRTEEGLPIVPHGFMNELVWSSLGKAQRLYPLNVCHLGFEGNHPHMVLHVENPEHLPLFVGYVKQEISHAINRLLGRRRKTVWAEGYDSPIVLDSEKALDVIAYALLNPVKDNLVESLEDYPGVNTWKLFKRGQHIRRCRMISRDSVPRLDNPANPAAENARVLDLLRAANRSFCFLKLSPYGWKKCFPDTAFLSDENVRHLIMARVAERAKTIAADRLASNLPRPLVTHILNQSMVATYAPKVFGKRMICLSTVPELRKNFIAFFRRQHERAREVLHQWRAGAWNVPFPIGLFPPAMPRRGDFMPICGVG